MRETVSISVDWLDLDDERVRRQLLTSLTALRGLQAAVPHLKPYLHVLVTDLDNASTFDVLITDWGRLDINSQTAASFEELGTRPPNSMDVA